MFVINVFLFVFFVSAVIFVINVILFSVSAVLVVINMYRCYVRDKNVILFSVSVVFNVTWWMLVCVYFGRLFIKSCIFLWKRYVIYVIFLIFHYIKPA